MVLTPTSHKRGRESFSDPSSHKRGRECDADGSEPGPDSIGIAPVHVRNGLAVRGAAQRTGFGVRARTGLTQPGSLRNIGMQAPFSAPATLGLGISEPIDSGLPNVVGYYLICAVGSNTAFVWIGNENKFTTLDFQIGRSQSQANDISADGTRIVGTVDVAGEGTRGFLFDGKVHHPTGEQGFVAKETRSANVPMDVYWKSGVSGGSEIAGF